MRLVVFVIVLTLVISSQIAIAQETEIGVTIQPILSRQFPDVPPAPAHIGLVRYTLPPGTSVPSGETTGPRVFFAESGEITVASKESDAGFRRAADAPPGQSSRKVTVAVLRPGDSYLPESPDSIDLRNDGARAAVFLDVFVFPTAPFGVVPHTTMDGVVVDLLVIGVADAVPAAPVELRLDRLAVDNGAELPLAVSTGPRFLVVESGTLGLDAEAGVISASGVAGNNPSSTAGRLSPVDPGSESLLNAREIVAVQAGASGVARNSGQTRLELLSIALTSANATVASARVAVRT